MVGSSLVIASPALQHVSANRIYLRRIRELYLNVVEWGPGVYGAESACRYYYHRTSARNFDRQQSAQLAAILPLLLKRRPDHIDH
jgi:monofunctional glycosyltransferase